MRVAVIGGGAVGAACALALRQAEPRAEVTVVEPDPGLALASSARSAASIRQQFSQPVNIALSRFGLAVIRGEVPWLDQAPGGTAALGFVPSGYLFLATRPEGRDALQAQWATQRAAGAAIDWLAPEALAAELPWLATDDLLGATLGRDGEGWFDGYAFARGLASQAQALGARWRRGRVVGGQRAGRADDAPLAALVLDDGSRLEADAVVLAAGAWSGAVGRALGLAVPVAGRHRTVFRLACPTALPRTPLVVDPSGVWFRSDGDGFLAGWSPGAGDDDPDDLPLDQPALQQFEDRVWPALAARVPAFEALRVRSAWDGWYEVHPLDHNALIGPHPHCANLVLACGFSGHGLQHAPGAGRGVAEWLLHGAWQTIDLSPLSPQRIVTGQAFAESAII